MGVVYVTYLLFVRKERQFPRLSLGLRAERGVSNKQRVIKKGFLDLTSYGMV